MHTLIAPPTPSCLLSHAVNLSGQSLATISARSGIRPKRLRRILDDKRYPKRREIDGLAKALDRWAVALGEELERAKGKVAEWEREDRERMEAQS